MTFASDSQELSFNSRGGTIEKAIVKNGGQWPQRKFLSRQTDAEGRPQPVEMVRRRPGMTLPGSTELKGDLVLSRVVAYETEQAADSVTFRTSTADLAFEKRYQVFKNSYELRLQIAVTNKSGAAKSTKLLVAYPAWVDPKTQGTGEKIRVRAQR